MTLNMDELLKLTVEKKASDLHITTDLSPHLRIDEKLVPTGHPPLKPDDARKLVYQILSQEQIKRFERDLELDMSFGIEGLSRFRVNIFLQRGNIGAAIRALPFDIMSFEECGLPVEVTTSFCKKPKGLVLVTGATGSGKSTTQASMIDKINSEKNCHIVTVEDPIEFVHQNKKAVVDQREIGSDTRSFAAALKHVLRQDPNVILIGEMRDLETIEAALNIAETGHLVLTTLHTTDSAQSINRIIDVFPPHQQQQVRVQLSFVLQGILAQQLIPKADGKGRVLGMEILIATPAVRSMIRDSKTHQIYSTIQTSQRDGMRTMNQALFELCRDGLITKEETFARTMDIQELKRLFER